MNESFHLKGEEEIRRYFFDRGYLHDCRIERVVWDVENGRLEFAIADANTNFLDLPEYPGREPVNLLFGGVLSLQVELAGLSERPRVYEASVSSIDERLVLHVAFSPSGRLKMCFTELSLGPSPGTGN